MTHFVTLSRLYFCSKIVTLILLQLFGPIFRILQEFIPSLNILYNAQCKRRDNRHLEGVIFARGEASFALKLSSSTSQELDLMVLEDSKELSL
ncbi:hypothetical protein L2E82_39363 [Cichorium intybus]|uniref:Uncharacterized protein n=1 Tax=Cichorium intybus TaxID=13427 RepID=A0ACB9AH99_CICIN|nr:hypothetical protein L2E82_39363 [Cichorium intybus]